MLLFIVDANFDTGLGAFLLSTKSDKFLVYANGGQYRFYVSPIVG